MIGVVVVVALISCADSNELGEIFCAIVVRPT